MNCKNVIISLVLYLGSLAIAEAQEVLVPAGMPAAAVRQVKKSTEIDEVPDTLDLPFFDDFSQSSLIPHSRFWTDDYVYINNTYTRDPVTIGVATFDAINAEGNLNGSVSTFESDFLTSLPINLNYPGRNDIWLSFFYEPKGLGEIPDEADSLTLEFFAVDSSTWETVWSTPGFEEEPAQGVDTFRQIFIPILEDRFLKKGFQFRFKNYVSLTTAPFSDDKKANGDHWNIDYIYLDTARSSNVTALNDVSMIKSLGSLLKTYQAIPWRHFPKAYLQELKSTLDISYRNNDTTVRNVTRILKITDLNYQVTDSVNGGAVNVSPGVLNTFTFPYNYPFIFYEADSTVFEIKSYLVTEDLDYKYNDTVVRYQRFYNYYAYDDGSAENGYGLRGEGTANASVAYRFETFKEDTLRGVKMYFNRTLDDFSQKYFKLGVWAHDGELDAPGELIYSMAGVRPEYWGLNEFFTYHLDTTIVLSGLFYVGWIKTTEYMLNVGWDVWNNHRDKIFYNKGQGWVNSSKNGCLMIRPVMGKELSFPASKEEIPEIRLQAYPNPAAERFYLKLPPGMSAGEWTVSLYNLQGKRVYVDRSGELQHFIGDLPSGLYIIRVETGGIFRASAKLMILR